uniref:Murine leukemia virus integrase C-terminal domain-containing protein n=1 Tax=Labrus bergylta TaxID=56723 RepID=A0A3Q3F3X5_9LABR
MEKVNTPFSHTALVQKPPPYEKETNAVQPGDKVFVKVFRRKWFNERREGPFEVVRSTGTAVQVKGSPTWYHLSHCLDPIEVVTVAKEVQKPLVTPRVTDEQMMSTTVAQRITSSINV